MSILRHSTSSAATILTRLILLMILSFYSVNGYIVGRLMSLQYVPSTTNDEIMQLQPSSSRAYQSSKFYYVDPVRRSVGTEEPDTIDENNEEKLTDENSLGDSKKLEIPRSYTKKSNYSSYKSLKKFTGNNSRNCFFSPIQCMLNQDMNKFKKIADQTAAN